jgi:hypothetical protein
VFFESDDLWTFCVRAVLFSCFFFLAFFEMGNKEKRIIADRKE